MQVPFDLTNLPVLLEHDHKTKIHQRGRNTADNALFQRFTMNISMLKAV